MEGPIITTKAESNLYRSWGMDVIGMTNLQEAKLAREAEICYVTVAMVTDYDCWHSEHDAVEVTDIIRIVLTQSSAANAARVVAEAVRARCRCRSYVQVSTVRRLQHALITDKKLVPRTDAIRKSWSRLSASTSCNRRAARSPCSRVCARE